MRRVTRNGVIAVVAASGAMAVTMPAFADSAADGAAAGSPGLISGNTPQLPAHAPVNVCGNTVNVAGLLNPATGNTCGNHDGASRPARGDSGARAQGTAKDSPGVIAGNGVQLPVHLPVDVTGNTVTVAGAGNAAHGNHSVNTPGHHATRPAPKPAAPPRTPRQTEPVTHPAPQPVASLAHTGTDRTVPAAVLGGAFVLGGALLYRRFRTSPSH